MSDERSAGVTQIAVAVVERDGKFLIGRRPEGAPLAGYWEFPGGKVRSNESPEAAAIRECLEETDLKVRVVGSHPTATHRYDHGLLKLNFFACRVIDEPVALPTRFRWVSRAELPNYNFPPANAELLRSLTR